MQIELTAEQRIALEAQHRKSRDRNVCDRIRCVLLSSQGWSTAMIAESQLIHETTVLRHIKDYLQLNKLKPENGGSDSLLSCEKTELLIKHLSQNLFHHTHEIAAYIFARWSIHFSIPGLNKWLHRQGFSYKKPCGLPHKFCAEKQSQFIEYYENLKVTVKDEPILFLDAVHPTQATKLSYGWIRKGERKTVKTTGSRTRLNLLGALNLNAIGNPVLQEYETINDYNICLFINEIRKSYPNYRQTIHLIMDGAGYNKTQRVSDWAFVSNVKLHYLPPYSPNLNPIERLWKVMNEHVRNNHYFASKHEFRDRIFNFFTTTLPDIANSLKPRINDNFQVLNTAS